MTDMINLNGRLDSCGLCPEVEGESDGGWRSVQCPCVWEGTGSVSSPHILLQNPTPQLRGGKVKPEDMKSFLFRILIWKMWTIIFFLSFKLIWIKHIILYLDCREVVYEYFWKYFVLWHYKDLWWLIFYEFLGSPLFIIH